MITITQTLEYILKSIISTPDEISITTSEDNGLMMIEIHAPAEVTGQIIGKQGKTIKAIRTILNLSFPSVKYLLEIRN